MTPSRNATLRLHLLALLCFTLIAFLILYALIFTTGTHFAGFDYFNYHWNYWFMRHVFSTPGLNMYETNYVFFPFVNNMGYHAFAAFWFPLWALLEPLAGTFAAVNAIIVLICILNGYLMFVFLRSEGVAPGLALLGGLVLQTLPIARYSYYNTHLNLGNWFWLPLHLLLWKQLVAQAGCYRRAALWAVVQGVALYGLGMTELQFPIFVAFLLVPYGLLTLWRTRRRVQVIAFGLLAVGIALALLWIAGPLRYMVQFRGTLAPGAVEGRPGVPFPDGFLRMADQWWWWEHPSLGGFVTVALLAAALLNLTALRKRMPPIRWFWAVAMLPPLLFALGPTFTLAGAAIPMPYRLLHAATNGMFGMPWRLAPIFVIAALVFIGQSWTPALASRPRTRVWLFVVAFLGLGANVRLFEAGPLTPLPPDYAFYRQIGQERAHEHYVLLEVPTGVGTGEVLLGTERAIQLQFYALEHGKRTVNGFISRAPVEHFWWVYRDDPMMAWLGQRRPLEAAEVERLLRERIATWPIGYIVIHQDLIGRSGPTPQEIIGFFNALPDLVCPIWVEGDGVVYRTAAHPGGCPARTPPEIAPGVYEIALGETGDERFIGWGWHWQESVPGTMVRWSGAGPQALLYIDLAPGAYTLTLSAQAFHRARTLEITVNGVLIGTAVVPVEGLVPLTFEIPANAVGDGKHVTLTLSAASADSPADVGLGDDDRKLAVMVDSVRFARRQ